MKDFLKEFKLKKTANTKNTHLCGFFDCPYQMLVKVLGQPHYIDDEGPDVYTEWSFGHKNRKYGISLYDHKEDGNGRKKKKYSWHIGARSGKIAVQFIQWLQLKTGINGGNDF